MLLKGASRKEVIRPDFNQTIRIDFQGAQIISDSSLPWRNAPHLNRPMDRPPKGGVQIKVADLHYQPKSWDKARRELRPRSSGTRESSSPASAL